MKKREKCFALKEWCLLIGSFVLIVGAYLIFDRGQPLKLIASLIGATAIIFAGKGNPVAQILFVAFSLIYGYISFFCAYYGEMLTYVGMTLPMSVFSFITWLKNPYSSESSQVRVNHLKAKEIPFMAVLTVIVTVGFYFILKVFGTANLIVSTFSVATSFLAVYLTFRRSPFYALAYALNDIVLIVLWLLAAIANPSYFSVVACFIAFFVNDINGFLSWRKMQREQNLPTQPTEIL